MQAISGVHFNYSFPAQFWEVYADAARAARQTRRNSARPAISTCCAISAAWAGWCCTCSAFRRRWAAISSGRSLSGLVALDAHTAYGPHATSLRMSDIGYRNRNQAGVSVSVNSLAEYLRDLQRAITTPHPAYQQLGLKRGDGNGCSSTPMCCRSRTSTTAPSAPSAWRAPAKARARRCGAAAWNTSRCARWMSARSIRWASTRPSCASSRPSWRCACCAPARPSMPASRPRIDDNYLKVSRRGREPGLNLARDGRHAAAGQLGARRSSIP